MILSSCQRPDIKPDLFSDNPSIRMLALGRLAELQSSEKLALLPDLMNALTSSDPKVAEKAGDALKTLGNLAMPSLAQAMNDSDPYVRLSVVEVIGQIGLSVPDVVRALAQGLTDPHPLVREQAGLTLGRSNETIGLLILALQDKNKDVRTSAAQVLKLLDTTEAREALKKHRLKS